jgi:hypothetical protein
MSLAPLLLLQYFEVDRSKWDQANNEGAPPDRQVTALTEVLLVEHSYYLRIGRCPIPPDPPATCADQITRLDRRRSLVAYFRRLLGNEVLSAGLADEYAVLIDDGYEARCLGRGEDRARLVARGARPEPRTVAIDQIVYDQEPRKALCCEALPRRFRVKGAAQMATFVDHEQGPRIAREHLE